MSADEAREQRMSHRNRKQKGWRLSDPAIRSAVFSNLFLPQPCFRMRLVVVIPA